MRLALALAVFLSFTAHSQTQDVIRGFESLKPEVDPAGRPAGPAVQGLTPSSWRKLNVP